MFRFKAALESMFLTKVLAHLLSASVGAYLALSLASAHLPGTGQWLRDFAKSPGLAACAALAAAVIAYRGIAKQVGVSHKSLNNQEQAKRSDTWWEMFKWASDRALPHDINTQNLPPSVTVSTLTELVTEATTNVQKVACRSVLEAVTQSVENEDPTLTGTDKENPKFDHAFADSLQNYIEISKNSAAASPVADERLETHLNAVRYEKQVFRALHSLEKLTTDIKFRSKHLNQPGDTGKDVVVEVNGQPVSVIIKFSMRDRIPKQQLLAQVRRFRASSDIPYLIVTQSAVFENGEEFAELGASVTQWQTDWDMHKLLDALRSVAVLGGRS